jgi:hypothetical protein
VLDLHLISGAVVCRYIPYAIDIHLIIVTIVHDHLSVLNHKNNLFCNLKMSTIAFHHALMPERSEGISCLKERLIALNPSMCNHFQHPVILLNVHLMWDAGAPGIRRDINRYLRFCSFGGAHQFVSVSPYSLLF